MADEPPTRCQYAGHPAPPNFPATEFAPHEFGWEHLGQVTPHLSDGRVLIETGETVDLPEETPK